jgi:uncharacterized protein
MMETPRPTPKRNFFQVIFVSPQEPRLRAGWRLLLQTIAMAIVAILASLGLSLLSNLFPWLGNGLLTAQVVEFITVTGSVFLARRLLDRRSFTSLGFKLDAHTLPDLLVGIAIPGVLMWGIFFAENGLGWLKFEGFAWETMPFSAIAPQLLAIFVTFIFVGWNEELLSRGYHLQTIASGTNLFWGVFISSSIFGLLHLGNPNATWVSAAGIFFAGLFLAFGLLRTRQLWLSIGLHIGWNFFEGPICGFQVSGLDMFHLTRITVNGPVLWTGGEFGPEAGLIVLPALLLGALLIYFYTRGRETVKAID